MSSGGTDISLIISSRNRAYGLPACLNAIGKAASNAGDCRIELVFVDNGSTDNTAEVVTGWAETAPLPVRLVAEVRPGLAVARNSGIRTAKGKLLAFTDDDCELHPDYFTDLTREFAGDTDPVLRGGRVDLGDERDLPVTIKTDPDPAVLDSRIHPGGFIHGCNMAFPRSLVQQVGWFDERFGAGAPFRSGEDTDYIHRAFKKGVRVAYTPTFVVSHYHGRRKPEDIHKLHSGYAFGNGALYAKYMFDRRSNMRGMLRWDLRMAARELWTGETLSREMGLTYRSTMRDSLAGMLTYWLKRPQTG